MVVFSPLRSLDEEIKLLSKELEGAADSDEDVQLLMAIPGIGYYTAVLMKSKIGDISRFPFPERLCSYAGLVPFHACFWEDCLAWQRYQGG